MKKQAQQVIQHLCDADKCRNELREILTLEEVEKIYLLNIHKCVSIN